jgi:hypothetical protein
MPHGPGYRVGVGAEGPTPPENRLEEGALVVEPGTVQTAGVPGVDAGVGQVGFEVGPPQAARLNNRTTDTRIKRD